MIAFDKDSGTTISTAWLGIVQSLDRGKFLATERLQFLVSSSPCSLLGMLEEPLSIYRLCEGTLKHFSKRGQLIR